MALSRSLILRKFPFSSVYASFENKNKYFQMPQSKSFLITNVLSAITIVEKTTIAEELGLPEPPKKPNSPFIQFCVKGRAKHPQLKLTEMVAKVSQDWKALEETVKDQYILEHHREHEDYKLKFRKYMASLSPKEVQQYEDLKAKRRIEKKKSADRKKFRKECQLYGKPKHPGHALSLFCENLERDETYINHENFLKYTFAKWKILPDEQKAEYKEKAKILFTAYKKELQIWEEKMIAEGRSNLVRQSSLAPQKAEKK